MKRVLDIIRAYEEDDWMNGHLGPKTGEYDMTGPMRRPFTFWERIVLRWYKCQSIAHRIDLQDRAGVKPFPLVRLA